MPLPVSRLRRWFAAGAILMVVVVAGMYLYARWRVRNALHDIPQKIGIEIQQTAEGFSISKSDEGRTLFTVSASKAVQFKQGGRAELHDVKIVVYGKDASRFDRITGDDFEYDPASGDVTAKGVVQIDLEANPEGLHAADQTAPQRVKNPIHIEASGLVFNRTTGNASVHGRVIFQTPQASGSAIGIQYVSKSGTLSLLSDISLDTSSSHARSYSATRECCGIIRNSGLTRPHFFCGPTIPLIAYWPRATSRLNSMAYPMRAHELTELNSCWPGRVISCKRQCSVATFDCLRKDRNLRRPRLAAQPCASPGNRFFRPFVLKEEYDSRSRRARAQLLQLPRHLPRQRNRRPGLLTRRTSN
jgi:hypothetical protein